MSDTRIEPQAGEGNNLPSWRFHVEKLGCIESGDFEVKPLTLLCGPNNTGKTWAMYALYGFLDNAVGNNNPSLQFPEIDEIAERLRNQGIYDWDFGEWLEKHSKELIGIINKGMKKCLPEIFNAPEVLFAKSRFDWVIEPEIFGQSGIQRKMDYWLVLGRERNSALRLFKPEGDRTLQFTLTNEKLPDLEFALSYSLLSHLLGAQNILFGVPDRSNGHRVFLIPAERSGLHLFRKELASKRTAFFHRAATLGDAIASRYAKPIADYMDWLNEIPESGWETKGFHVLAEQVKAIVEGKYEVDADGSVSFTPEKSDAKLDFHLSSSTVKSLFGLWFYLAHEAKPGDTLMIDEPELNLHPANQRALARVLVRLVNKGLRVVVSTHSDFIVREINNLIMLHTPFDGREELAKKFNYEDKDSIGHEQVAAYLFDGGTIEPMEVGPEEGIIAETFDQVIHSLNKSSNEIFYIKRDAVE